MLGVNVNLYDPSVSIPFEMPSNACLAAKNLVEGNWLSGFLRVVVPGYASKEDHAVDQYFLEFFKQLASEKQTVPIERLKAIIDLTQKHINISGKDDYKRVADLERYVLAARINVNYFKNESRANLQSVCKEHNKKLYTRWEKVNLGENARDKGIFWTNPELVDFIFTNHLHRNIRHPDYQHHVKMLSTKYTPSEEGWRWQYEPHLLMNGEMTPWKQIRDRISVDENHKLFSTENGKKQYWMYLENGLIPHDRNNFDHLVPFKTLPVAPAQSLVQVVTTHVPTNKLGFQDRFLNGARHAFLRVVFREGFAKDHPELPFKDGEVYSFGWGYLQAFPTTDLLASVKGSLFSPDGWEFFNENLCVTDLPEADEKIIGLMKTIDKHAKADGFFQMGNNNCTSKSVEILREAGIVDLKVKKHVSVAMYKLLLPKSWRNPIERTGEFLASHAPSIVSKVFFGAIHFVSSLIFVPIFILLGGRKVLPYYEGKTLIQPANHANALFSKFSDLFDANKISGDVSDEIYQWQQKQAALHPENYHFVQQP